MSAPAFNLTAEAQRKMMVCYVDVSEGGTTPEWEAQGYKTEDQSISFNPDKSTITDILGDTYTDVNKLEWNATFEPNTLRAGTKLNPILLEYARRDLLPQMSQFRVLLVYGFIGNPGDYEADMWDGCTITPTELGGSSRVGMPFEIDFGGTKQLGTVNAIRSNNIVFTPENN